MLRTKSPTSETWEHSRKEWYFHPGHAFLHFSLFNKLKPGGVKFGACIRQVFGVTVGLQNTRGLGSVVFIFYFNTPLHLKVALPSPH